MPLTNVTRPEFFWPAISPTAVAEQRPATITLDGVDYPIDIEMFRRASIDSTREGVTSNNSLDESLFDHEGSWWRRVANWSHGKDPTVNKTSHDLEDGDERMYYTDIGISTVNGDVRLGSSPSTVALALTSSNNFNAEANGFMYVADGTNVKRASKGSPTVWTTLTAPGGTITGMTTDGWTVYVATTTGISRYTSAATTVDGTSGTVNNWGQIWFCANRLIGAIGNSLYDIGPTTKTLIATHYQVFFAWTTVFALGSKIYAGGYAGTHSELLTLIALDDGTLARGQEAAAFTEGEVLYTGIAHAGIAVLALSNTVRVATPGGDGTLTYGPAIAMGDSLVGTLVGIDQYVYVGGGWLTSSESYAILDLSVFTDVLRPVLLHGGFTGVNTQTMRGFFLSTSGTLIVVAQAANVYYELNDYVLAATLVSSKIWFGTREQKRMLAFSIQYEALPAGCSVTANIVDEGGAVLINNGSATTGSTGFLMTPNEGLENLFGYCVLHLTLNSASAALSPKVTSWSMRAIPVPKPAQRWILPLHIGTLVNRGGEEFSFDVDTEVERLITLWKSKLVVSLRVGDTTHRVRIDKFEHRPMSWDGHQLNGVFLVEAISA